MISILNQIILRIISILPKKIVFIFAGKYVAGENINTLINATRHINDKGFDVTIDILGEHVKDKNVATEITKQYSNIYEQIQKNNLKSNISLKPSHIGLDISYDFCLKNLLELSGIAKKYKNFLRIDMEDSKNTSKTIKLLNEAHKHYDNIGTVFQAYLIRTIDDIKKLNYKNINYRLCKGIYNESSNIAIKDRNKINDNYIKILEEGFKRNHYIGIATHDIKLLERVYKLIKKYNVSKNQFEFQILYGVPMHGWLERHLSNEYKVRVYIPFGPDWYEYSIRRLKENPNILWYVLKNIFGN